MTSIFEMKDHRPGECPVCAHIHKGACNHHHMAERIFNLMKANSAIPSLMEANKEAVDLARHFQSIVRQADQVMSIMQEVLSGHGEIGETIKTEIFGRLDQWASQTTSQDTETPEASRQENTIPNETESKLCIGGILNGEYTASVSSIVTTNATPAEKKPE